MLTASCLTGWASGLWKSHNNLTMTTWRGVLDQRLQHQREQHLERSLTAFQSIDTTHIQKPGADRALINFSSNDYLGLRSHPELAAAIAESSRLPVAGAGAARLLSGNHPLHEQLELELAEFFSRDAAMLFSTGYVANLAVLQALGRRGDVIIQDRLCHASLIDGARLADSKLLRYRHLDTDHCQTLLEQPAGLQIVTTDGVFSMDGDLAPVTELAGLARSHEALLIVDDAHGIGVLGEQGLGLLEHAGLSQADVPLLLGTFGKSFGLAGAFVAGDQQLIDYLRNFARGWIYSTAPPLPLVAAQRRALQITVSEPERRHRLHQRISYFKQLAKQLQLPLLPSDTAIQPIQIGPSAVALDLQAKLETLGFYVAAIRPPTVPKGTARLRITLSSEHQQSDIDRLLMALAENIGQFSDAD